MLESFVTTRRDKAAALAFIKKSMKRHGRTGAVAMDVLRSHGAALEAIGATGRQETARWLNNRVENSHQPFRRRERAMERFRRMKTLQTFAAVHGTVHNLFNQERHLISRDLHRKRRSAALAEGRAVIARMRQVPEQQTQLALASLPLGVPRPPSVSMAVSSGLLRLATVRFVTSRTHVLYGLYGSTWTGAGPQTVPAANLTRRRMTRAPLSEWVSRPAIDIRTERASSAWADVAARAAMASDAMISCLSTVVPFR